MDAVTWLVELRLFAWLKPNPTSPNTLNSSLNLYCAHNEPAAPVFVAVDFSVVDVTP